MLFMEYLCIFSYLTREFASEFVKIAMKKHDMWTIDLVYKTNFSKKTTRMQINEAICRNMYIEEKVAVNSLTFVLHRDIIGKTKTKVLVQQKKRRK